MTVANELNLFCLSTILLVNNDHLCRARTLESLPFDCEESGALMAPDVLIEVAVEIEYAGLQDRSNVILLLLHKLVNH